MSYQSTTPNFDLPQWVYTDPPQMNDFNTAFANIDGKAVPITRTVNGKPLSSNITLSPSDVGAQPQTSVRDAMVKADASGKLVEAVEGEDYITGGALPLQLEPTVELNGSSEFADVSHAGNVVTVNFGLKAKKGINAYENFAYIPERLKRNRIIRFTLWVNNSPTLGNVYGEGGINSIAAIPVNATVFGFFSYSIE